ncbi:MAG: 3D domain-containing protein [Candidatus Brocadiia bacterium]|jgi:3D (Asp-Asp-Asp) domain-containing protein
MKTIITIPILFLILTASAAAVAPATAPAPRGTWTPMGEYRVTGYSACVACCGKSDGITADGTYAPGFKGVLVSAPKDIPFGTKLWIEGVGLVEVHDRGGAIKGRRVELFFQKYNDAVQWGVQKRQVWIWKNNG